MRHTEIFRAWGKILSGNKPCLSLEITNKCPLTCPGCYAYQPDHVSGTSLISLADFQGEDLVEKIVELIDIHRPLLVHIIGGEPLVRFRELNELLPRICDGRLKLMIVTSAVRPIPSEWAAYPGLSIAVSIDGLQPEHDVRRKPATYERILKHIQGHRITVHCVVTSQMARREGYLDEFVDFWSERPEARDIHMSLFTPQIGETSEEILDPEMKARVVSELGELDARYPKLKAGPAVRRAFLEPPDSPEECLFARVTHCLSADLESIVSPCQLGGNPDCSKCGCSASMGLHAVGRHQLPGGVRVESLLRLSERVGSAARALRFNGSS